MPATLKQFLHVLRHGPETDERDVHFHRGPQGAPAACHDARCQAPRRTL
jgi:hypothetical protein